LKTFFIHATAELADVKFDVEDLPAKVGIVSTIQYLSEMGKVRRYLEDNGKKAVIGGQVLGCDQVAALAAGDVDGYLYVGTGEFHPIGVALKTKKPVWILNPQSMAIEKLDDKKIVEIEKRRKIMLTKFYSSEVIGVLQTTKKGQSRAQVPSVEDIYGLEKKFPEKKFYYFLCETLDFKELENFPFVECWVNTMCPRIMEDIRVLNIEDLP